MIALIILIIINSLAIVGLWNSWQYEEQDNNTKGVFWFYKCYILDRIPYRLSKPFGNCLRCMASVFGLPFYFHYYDLQYWFYFPFYALAVSGLNTLFDKYLNE